LESVAIAGTKAEAGANAAKVALTNLAPSLDGVSKSAANMIIKQQQQIDLYGKGREESMAYQATIKGLSESQVLLAGGLGAQMDAMKSLGAAQAEAIAMNAAMEKSNVALGESEGVLAARHRKIAEEAIAFQRSMNVQQDASSTPNVWRKGGSSGFSSGSATAMQQTPSVTRDAETLKTVAKDTAALAVQQDILGESTQRILKTYDPYHVKMDTITNDIHDLTAAHAAGNVATDQFNRTLGNLNAAKVATELKATEKAAKDAGEGLLKFSLESSIAKREGITIVREAIRGDFTRMAGSLSIFANATGLMGSAMAVLASPLTWVVAALGAFAIAAEMGSSEIVSFNKQLILTGGHAGVTASQFAEMSKEIGGIAGGQHSAAAALTEIASTGRFAGDQLKVVGKTAVEMQEDTGQAVDKTIGIFEKLAKEPVKASMALNEQYHYLTSSVYDQIAALVEQGKTHEATTVAFNAFGDAVDSRHTTLEHQAWTIAQGWKDVKTAVEGAVNAMMNVGRVGSASQQIAELQSQIAEATTHKGTASSLSKMLGRGGDEVIDAQIAGWKKQITGLQIDEKAAQATLSINNAVTAMTDKSNEAKSAIDARNMSMKGSLRLAQDELVIRRQFADLYKDPNARNPKNGPNRLAGVTFDENGQPTGGGNFQEQMDAARKRDMPAGRKPRSNEYGIKDQLAIQQTAYAQEEQDLAQNLKDIKNLYDIGQSDQKTFLAETLEAKDEALGKEYNIATKEYEIAKGEKNLAAKEKYATLMQTILGKMVNNSTQFASDIAKVQNDEVNAIAAYSAKLTKVETLRQDEMDNAIKSSSVGATTAAQYALLLKLQKEYDTQMAALDASHDKTKPGSITDEAYAADVARLKAHHATMVASETQFVADMKDVDSKWQTGADKAFDAYQTSAANIASQSETAFTNAFTGMENALTSFATTGKLSFKSLVTSILTDIARMEAKAATSKLLGVLMEMGQAYFGSGTGATTQSAPASTQVYSQASGYKLGGAFDSGVQKFADGGSFTNGVVNSPTNFNMGQMGEAGPEAIVPLTRTSDGSLGVKQIGGSGGGSSGPVNVNTTINVQGGSATANTTGSDATQVHKQFADAMSNAAQAEIAKQMRQGGLLWKMKNGQTGGNG
jgi:lambda family phage tail tape measure protein